MTDPSKVDHCYVFKAFSLLNSGADGAKMSHTERGTNVQAWYLVTTKLKGEMRVKENLESKHGLEAFFPCYPPKKKSSRSGLPLFARYVFVRCDIMQDFSKLQYTPGLSKVVCFGAEFVPVPDDVITCLKARCNDLGQVLPPELAAGQRVRVKQGVFEGCEGIIQEKRGNRRVQLLLQMAFGPSIKVEFDTSDIELG